MEKILIDGIVMISCACTLLIPEKLCSKRIKNTMIYFLLGWGIGNIFFNFI